MFRLIKNKQIWVKVEFNLESIVYALRDIPIYLEQR